MVSNDSPEPLHRPARYERVPPTRRTRTPSLPALGTVGRKTFGDVREIAAADAPKRIDVWEFAVNPATRRMIYALADFARDRSTSITPPRAKLPLLPPKPPPAPLTVAGRRGEKSRFDPWRADVFTSPNRQPAGSYFVRRPAASLTENPNSTTTRRPGGLNDLGISVVTDKNVRKPVINYAVGTGALGTRRAAFNVVPRFSSFGERVFYARGPRPVPGCTRPRIFGENNRKRFTARVDTEQY